ncbi:hypothetical protein FB45DRAFT_863200 [Roridomyces roridus]|uniref:Uncharacterized protein n=1 Tax=Roridomyces roridus TaxID=1738132 RepID=A0AAD7C8X4_9AGAR|nr:hypothetical protein FB45DRAFT_863200 [Roridomyces roridus]
MPPVRVERTTFERMRSPVPLGWDHRFNQMPTAITVTEKRHIELAVTSAEYQSQGTVARGIEPGLAFRNRKASVRSRRLDGPPDIVGIDIIEHEFEEGPEGVTASLLQAFELENIRQEDSWQHQSSTNVQTPAFLLGHQFQLEKTTVLQYQKPEPNRTVAQPMKQDGSSGAFTAPNGTAALKAGRTCNKYNDTHVGTLGSYLLMNRVFFDLCKSVERKISGTLLRKTHSTELNAEGVNIRVRFQDRRQTTNRHSRTSGYGGRKDTYNIAHLHTHTLRWAQSALYSLHAVRMVLLQK